MDNARGNAPGKVFDSSRTEPEPEREYRRTQHETGEDVSRGPAVPEREPEPKAPQHVGRFGQWLVYVDAADGSTWYYTATGWRQAR